jgi:hypothetical protein
MKILGYILQYLDEDSLTPNGPGKRLYSDFQEVLYDAHELIQKWYETNTETNDGPIEYQSITRQMVENQSSVLLFRSRDVFIWIEIVYA